MLSSRRRVSAMLTRTREPSQSYHVAAVCGEPSLRSVAMTAGFGLRSIASASGGSGGFGIALSFLVPVAFEPEEGLLDGSRVAVVRSPFAFVGDEVLLGGGDELVLRHPVAAAEQDLVADEGEGAAHYRNAAPVEQSFLGLERYWHKKGERDAEAAASA